MIKSLLSILLLVSSFLIIGQINSDNPKIPFGSNTSYKYGMMPTNLPTSGAYGKSTDAANAYNFWKSTYVEDCGSGRARVKFDNTSETVSEGIAYGMLIVVYAGDKPLFDKLWAYYKNFRNNNGVMHWKINGCNSVKEQNGATDAELDAAMALIIANKQWPNSTTPHNYVSDAKTLINAIKNVETNNTNYTFENGDYWKPACRNPSYQATAYARAYKLFMNENGTNQDSFWNNVANGTENLHKANAHPSSGLSTNWCLPSGKPDGSCSGSGTAPDKFGYDAARAPWRQGTDILWWGPTSGMQSIVDRQIDFWISKGGAGQIRGGDGMNHDGSGTGDNNNVFVGMVGAQSLAGTNTTQRQAFCNAAYSQNKNLTPPNYFNATLKTIGIFVQTGNFWNPYDISTNGNNPSVTISSPYNATACLNLTITLNATASDSDGNITKVEFYEGSTKIGEKTTAPYSLPYTFTTSGVKSFSAKAFDNSNNSTTSSSLNFNTTTITSPTGTSCAVTSQNQDWKGFIDDFDSVKDVSVGGSSAGVIWWVSETAAAQKMYTINRTTSGMKVTLDNANKPVTVNNVPKASYEVFGLNFGGTISSPNTINLKELSNSNITINLTNNSDNEIFLAIQLKDSKGVTSEIAPADASAITWNNKWAKIGVVIPKGTTKNFTIDLSTRANELGGLTAKSWDCGSALACPTTAYELDATKIAQMVFIVNGGASTTDEPNRLPATGDLVFNYLSLGDVVAQPSKVIKAGISLGTDKIEELTNSVNVYPNPAQSFVNITQNGNSFDKFELVDLNGHSIISDIIEGNQSSINIQGFTKGIYILKLNGSQGAIQKKIVIE